MLEKIIKHHKLLAVVLFGLVYAIFFYLASDSIGGAMPIDDEKPRVEQEIETHETNVTLEIEQNGVKSTYAKKMLSIDNFEDLLEQFREDRTLIYEIRAYSNGTIVSSINGVENTSQNEWKLYLNDSSEEITDVLNTQITKNAVFKLKFIRI